MSALFSSGRPIMGDLLRAAVWCACASPKSRAAQAVWDAFDKALAKAAAPRASLRQLQQRVHDVSAPWVAPMEVSAADWPLILRLWRLCQAFGYSKLQLGSADAVGFGYGVQLRDTGDDEYFTRRPPEDSPAVYLGLRPQRLPLPDLMNRAQVEMKLEKTGIGIRGSLRDKKLKAQDVELSSWIVNLRHPIPGDLGTVCMSTYEYDVALDKNTWWVRALSPESAIRFGGHCAAGALLGFVPDESFEGPEANLVFLRAADEAPTELSAERHSRSGHLADWLRFPAVPIVLELSARDRAALDAEHVIPISKLRKD